MGGDVLEILVDKGSDESWDVMLSYPVNTLRVAHGLSSARIYGKDDEAFASSGIAPRGFFEMDEEDQEVFYATIQSLATPAKFKQLFEDHLSSVEKRVVYITQQMYIPDDQELDIEEEEESNQLDFLNLSDNSVKKTHHASNGVE